MSLPADVQKLQVGDVVTLYILDAEPIGAETYHFHSHDADLIMWQGVRYDPWPLEASGFEMSGSRNPTPSLKMGNVGGFITALCLQFDDLVGAKLTRKRTLAKYLDGMPDADPDEEFAPEIWFIEQKTGENSEAVEFELASAMDFQGVQLPRRQIIANHCPWRYRSAECGTPARPWRTSTTSSRLTRPATSAASGCRAASCDSARTAF